MCFSQGNLTNPTSPYSSIDVSTIPFPSFTAPGNGLCNADLPNDSTLNRYLYVVQYYVQQVTRRHLPAHALGCPHMPHHACTSASNSSTASRMHAALLNECRDTE